MFYKTRRHVPCSFGDTLVVGLGARRQGVSDVPTMTELGVPVVYGSPFGIAGPKGMDPAVMQKLHHAFKKRSTIPRFSRSWIVTISSIAT